MKKDVIRIKGAKEHNLKNVDLEIPRNEFVVLTGLSGSGKSSLAEVLKSSIEAAIQGHSNDLPIPAAGCLIDQLRAHLAGLLKLQLIAGVV